VENLQVQDSLVFTPDSFGRIEPSMFLWFVQQKYNGVSASCHLSSMDGCWVLWSYAGWKIAVRFI